MDPREELRRFYHWLRQYGYNDSHSGNISCREQDHFWITPTGACADLLEPSDLIPVPLHGPIPEGASGDAALHQQVYQRNPSAGGVIHSHGPYTVGMTMDGQDFRPTDFEGQLYFPLVPVLEVAYEVYFQEAAQQVAEALSEYPVCVVRGHGVYACASSLELAYKWTCSLELSAKTAFIAQRQSKAAKP